MVMLPSSPSIHRRNFRYMVIAVLMLRRLYADDDVEGRSATWILEDERRRVGRDRRVVRARHTRVCDELLHSFVRWFAFFTRVRGCARAHLSMRTPATWCRASARLSGRAAGGPNQTCQPTPNRIAATAPPSRQRARARAPARCRQRGIGPRRRAWRRPVRGARAVVSPATITHEATITHAPGL